MDEQSGIIILTKEDFLSSGLKEAVEPITDHEHYSYFQKFAAKGNETSDEKQKRIFILFAMLMASPLTPDSRDKPFANIDGFSPDNISFFLEIVDLITNDEIKSRLYDLIWLRTKDYRMAEKAAMFYLNCAKCSEDFENWTATAARLERAFGLSAMLGKKGELYNHVLTAIVDLLDRCNGEDPLYLSAELMRLLQERGAGDPKKYAGFCEKLAIQAEHQFDFDRARRYWSRKVQWHYQDKDEDAARAAKLSLARSFEKESEHNLETKEPKYSLACYPLEQAIVAYRNAGNSAEKIEELKITVREYQKRAVAELIPIQGESIDITHFVIAAEKAVSRKPFLEALKCLALLSPPSQVGLIRKQVEENREKYIFSKMFPEKLFDSSGRVIAVQPSDGEEAVLIDMFKYARTAHQIAVQSFINPARRIINLEHSARDLEFYYLLLNHPFIEEDREFIVARGLHAGLLGDFLTASHFLIPQIENSVRNILVQRAIIPASFSAEGIQEEYSLNKLLSDSKFVAALEELFGEDILFDLRCLLVERFGWNLRNDMAHGLTSYGHFNSHGSIYFWWIALRFYLLPYIVQSETPTERG